jgi:hypothetical protein
VRFLYGNDSKWHVPRERATVEQAINELQACCGIGGITMADVIKTNRTLCKALAEHVKSNEKLMFWTQIYPPLQKRWTLKTNFR